MPHNSCCQSSTLKFVNNRGLFSCNIFWMEWDDALILWRCCVKSHSNLWNAWWETLLLIINYRMGIMFVKGKYLSMPKFLFLNIISMKYVLHILSHDWVITHCHDQEASAFWRIWHLLLKNPSCMQLIRKCLWYKLCKFYDKNPAWYR